MCATCGCDTPNDNHGDSANITMVDIERAAEAAGLTTGMAVDNIVTAASSYRS